MKTDEAMDAYKQALDLRPNYVRTLVNIGLAQNNKFAYLEGAQYFLTALCLNP
jgi:peroxin-5